jgi:plastocyanin
MSPNPSQLAGRAPRTPAPARRGPRLARLALLGAGILALLASAAVRAEESTVVELAIRDHRFVPAEVRVPAGRPLVLRIRNEDATAEEFESKALKVEKVIAGGKTGTVRLRALAPGRYAFVGEFHESTAAGTLIAE